VKKRVIVTLVLIATAVAGYFVVKKFAGRTSGGKQYVTAAIARGDVLNTITSTGTLKPVSTVEVGTQVSGIINKLYVDFNDTVTEGQLIAEIDRTFLLGALDEALASQHRARALFTLAQKEYTRNEPLFKKGFISEQEFAKLETDLETQKATLQSADASVKKAQTNLKFATITSPITGTVIERNIEAGQTVAASFSAPTLFVIAENLRKMQILASVDEADIGGIEKGQEVSFSVQAFSERSFSGVVEQVRLQPTVTQNVVTYTVVIGTDNVDGTLLPGMTATVDFITKKVENVLVVPNAALRFTPDGADSLPRSPRLNGGGRPKDTGTATAMSPGRNGNGKTLPRAKERKKRGTVWVLSPDNTLVPQAVKTGLTDGKNTEIQSPQDIHEGMLVVTGVTIETKKKKKSVSLLPQPGPPGRRP